MTTPHLKRVLEIKDPRVVRKIEKDRKDEGREAAGRGGAAGGSDDE